MTTLNKIETDSVKGVFFEKISDFNSFIFSNPKKLNLDRYNTVSNYFGGNSFYGNEGNYSLNELKEKRKSTPVFVSRFDRYLSDFKGENPSLNFSVTEKRAKKIVYSSYPVGVFSFDRASIGLKKIYKIDLTNKFTSVSTKVDIEKGVKKTTTTTKNVYATFERSKADKAVDLYFCGGIHLYQDSSELFNQSILLSLLCDFYKRKKVATNIYIFVPSKNNDITYFACVKIKEAKDDFNPSLISFYSADASFFRCQGFLSLVKSYDTFNKKIPSGLGKAVNDINVFADCISIYRDKMKSKNEHFLVPNIKRDSDIRDFFDNLK